MGRRLPGIQAGEMVIGRREEVRDEGSISVRGVQCRAEDMFGEGSGLPTDEVYCGGGVAPPPSGGGGGAQGGAEDVADAVHEGWSPGKCVS